MSHNKDVIQSKGRKGQQGQQQDKASLQGEIVFARLSMDNVPGERLSNTKVIKTGQLGTGSVNIK